MSTEHGTSALAELRIVSDASRLRVGRARVCISSSCVCKSESKLYKRFPHFIVIGLDNGAVRTRRRFVYDGVNDARNRPVAIVADSPHDPVAGTLDPALRVVEEVIAQLGHQIGRAHV